MASDAGEIFDEHGGDAMAIAELLAQAQAENKRLRTQLAVHAHYRALGGPPPAITEQWKPGTVPPPPSASDETAPPHERGR